MLCQSSLLLILAKFSTAFWNRNLTCAWSRKERAPSGPEWARPAALPAQAISFRMSVTKNLRYPRLRLYLLKVGNTSINRETAFVQLSVDPNWRTCDKLTVISLWVTSFILVGSSLFHAGTCSSFFSPVFDWIIGMPEVGNSVRSSYPATDGLQAHSFPCFILCFAHLGFKCPQQWDFCSP